MVWRLIQLLFACYIPPTADLRPGVKIAHGVGIVIHQNSVIGSGTIIYQNVTVGSGKGPRIGENCVLGAGCCILGDIHIVLLITLFDRILLTIGGRQRQSIAPA